MELTGLHECIQLLIAKQDEPFGFLLSSSIIVGMSETWRNGSIPDALFSVDQYRLFRRDRQHGRGGEVATCTCSSFPGAG